LYHLKYKDADETDRKVALDELTSLSKEFTEVAHESPTLADKVFDTAAKTFAVEQKKTSHNPYIRAYTK
jgi:hypothetical protein